MKLSEGKAPSRRPRAAWLVFPFLLFVLVVAVPSTLRLQWEVTGETGVEESSSGLKFWGFLKAGGYDATASVLGHEEQPPIAPVWELGSDQPAKDPLVNSHGQFPKSGYGVLSQGIKDVEAALMQEELQDLNSDDIDPDIHLNRHPLSAAGERLPQGLGFSFTDIYMDPQTRPMTLPIATANWNASRVFVISMTRDAKRLEQLDAQLKGVGMQYTVVFTVDTTAKDFNYSRYGGALPESRRSEYRQSPLSTIEVELSLTHLEIWSHIVAQELSYALVLEEDAILQPSFQADFERAMKQLSLLELQQTIGSAFDVCMLTRFPWTWHGERFLTSNIMAARPSIGGVANLLSLQGARKLLQHAVIDDPINEVMWQVHQLSWVAVEPVMVNNNMYSRCGPGEPCRPMPTPSTTPSKSLAGLQGAAGSWQAGALTGKCVSEWDCVGLPLRNEHSEVEKQRKPFRTRMPEKMNEWPVMMMNMERDVRRLEHMRSQLQSHGFGPVVRAIAVDMSSTEIATFDHLIAKDRVSKTRAHWGWMERILSKGDVGCALSHYRIWSEIVAQRIPWTVVLEDDIDLGPDFREHFEQNVGQLNELIAEGHDLSNFDGVLIGREPITPAVYERPNIKPNLVVAAMSWTTHSYILSLEGAKKLQRHFYVDDPIDALWWRVPKIRFLSFSPTLTKQMRDNFGSTAGDNGLRGQVQPWRRRALALKLLEAKEAGLGDVEFGLDEEPLLKTELDDEYSS